MRSAQVTHLATFQATSQVLTKQNLQEIVIFQAQSELLETSEKVVKWGMKTITMVGVVFLGNFLGRQMGDLSPPYLGNSIGNGVAFIPGLKILAMIDDGFKQRAIKRALEKYEIKHPQNQPLQSTSLV